MNPNNWFWFIGSDQTQVFSSAAAALLPISHPEYLAWVSAYQTTAPTIGSYSALYDLLSQQNPAVANTMGITWAQSGLLTTSQSLTSYISNGVQVFSSGVSGINGVYPINSIAILEYNVAKLQVNAGALAFPQFFPDATGTLRTFPSSGVFNVFFTNIINYFQSIQTLGAGASGTWPQPVLTF